jgi:hypothetical protein
MDLDLDIINGNQSTVRIFGKDVKFRDLSVEEYLKAEFMMGQLDTIMMDSDENIEKAAGVIQEYLFKILELTRAEAKKVTIKQFQALREYIAKKDLYDQGFNDKEIAALQREALKKMATSQK